MAKNKHMKTHAEKIMIIFPLLQKNYDVIVFYLFFWLLCIILLNLMIILYSFQLKEKISKAKIAGVYESSLI